MSLDALLEACRLAPDDDVPRLVWADAVGGERGELVVIQCDLARGGLTPTEAGARLRRERQLLDAHDREWTGFDHCQGRFRRGFVETIWLSAPMFLEQSEEIFRHAPLLRSLHIDYGSIRPLEVLRQLLELPAFWRLDGLELHRFGVGGPGVWDVPGSGDSGDELVRLLVESGMVKQLRALSISRCGLTSTGLQYLTTSAALERLERLRLRGNRLDDDAVLTVVARAPQMKSLELDLDKYTTIVPALPPVTDLYLSRIDDQTLDALGRSRAAPTIERLRIESCRFERGDGFRAFPRLRLLDLRNAELADPVRALAGLPALRRLYLGEAGSDGLESLLSTFEMVRALGPQLEQFWLEDINASRGLVDELRRCVAGDLLNEGPLYLDHAGW